MNMVLTLLAVQGLIGAFDNIWHHELSQKLNSKPSALTELKLHTVREFFYAVIFLSIAWVTWNGVWTYVLIAIIAIEIVITLWDFVVEDMTRKLPKLERVVHTVMAINLGAILALWAPVLLEWARQPTGFTGVDYGILSWIIAAYGAGVLAWGIYDLRAVLHLLVPAWQRRPIRAGYRAHPKTVLITGATGFIGRALTRALISRGDRVIALARDVDKARFLFGPHVRAVQDLDEIDQGEAIDAIVNLAGEPILCGLWTKKRKQKFVASRVGTTEQLLDLVARLDARPEVLVSGSAIGYYGLRQDEVLTEDDGPQDHFMSELCQRWENAAGKAEALGVRVALLRIGLVLGLDGGALPQLALPVRLGLGAVLGSGRQWMSWIHITDLVRMILFAVDSPHVEGPINATAPKPATNRAFTKALGRHLKRPVWLRIPTWPVKALLGDLADVLVAGQKVLPQAAEDFGFTFERPTLGGALEDLFAPTAHVNAADCAIYYNDKCPVCSAEINHYQHLAEAEDLPVTFCSISENGASLNAFGVSADDIKRRIFVRDQDGNLHGGADGVAIMWQALPRYRWAGNLIKRPVINGIASAVYDGVAAPLLYRQSKRRENLKAERAHG